MNRYRFDGVDLYQHPNGKWVKAEEAEDRVAELEAERKGMICAPIIDWVGTGAPDPRDAYTTRINGHVVGVHASEEAARNHAWALEAYIRAQPEKDGREDE